MRRPLIIGLSPWRRAPRLLLRRPGVLAAVAGACLVLVASAAAVPLFLSGAGSEAVTVQAEERCGRDTGATFVWSAGSAEVANPDPDPYQPLQASLEPGVRWVQMETTMRGDPSAGLVAVVALDRDGATEHVELIEGNEGGLWISDRAADLLKLGVGDDADVGGMPIRIDGIYRDLAGAAVDDYWCAHADLLLLEGIERIPPPPVLLLDDSTFASLMDHQELAQQDQLQPRIRVGAGWEASLRVPLTPTAAEDLVVALACGTPDAPDLLWCQAGRSVPPDPATADPADLEDDQRRYVTQTLHSHLPFITKRTRAIQTAVGGGIWPVAGFAALAGTGLVAAAAALWYDRRRREVNLLVVRGASPSAVGAKAVLELVPALIVGTAGGAAAAYGLVSLLGPSGTFESTAVRQAVLLALGAGLLAAVVIAGSVAWRVQAHHVRAGGRGWLRFLPFELLLGGLTFLAYRRLDAWGVPVGKGEAVSRVDVLGILFPILFLATAVAVAMRLLLVVLDPVVALSRRWPMPLYLAIRRVRRHRGAVVGLVGASAMAVGVLVYSATLNQSLEATLQAKASTYIGSDVVVRLGYDATLPDDLRGVATGVELYRGSWIDGGQREGVLVKAIDPATVADAAYWDDSFADVSLDEILRRLQAPPRDGKVPAVVTGLVIPPIARNGVIDVRANEFEVEPVAEVQAFPGMRRSATTVFITQQAAAELGLPGPTAEAWIRGDRAEVLADLQAARTVFREDRQLTEVADRSSFLTVSWTFGFTRSLGFAAGVLVIGGLASYLDSRRRARVLGYAFARRMGLGRGQHRLALLAELVASVLVGSLLGLGAALLGAWVAYEHIDPVPGFRPDPLFRVAATVCLALLVTAVVVVIVTALVAQRRVDRDDPVEVLRAGV